jgi:hypothetical protein
MLGEEGSTGRRIEEEKECFGAAAASGKEDKAETPGKKRKRGER